MIVTGDPRRPQYPAARWRAAGGGCDWVTRCSATSRVIMAAAPVPATIRMIPAGGLRRPQYPAARWEAAGGGCDWVTRCSATSRVIMAAAPVPATIRMIPAGGLRRPQHPGARHHSRLRAQRLLSGGKISHVKQKAPLRGLLLSSSANFPF